MSSRSTNLRTKVVALLVSLAALWAFAAWVTLRDGLNLLWVQTLDSKVFDPNDRLLLALQQERRLSVAYLGRPSEQQRAPLAAERQKSEELAAAFRRSIESQQVELAASTELKQRLDELTRGLDGLARTRAAINTQDIDRASASDAYTRVIDSIFRVFDSMAKLDDHEIAKDTTALIELNRARELVSQEDALVTGIIAAGRITAAEHAQFAQLVGAQRFIANETALELPAVERERYDQLVDSQTFLQLRTMEDRIIQSIRPGSRVSIDIAQWRAGVEPSLADMREIVVTGGEHIVDRAMPIAIWVVLRVVLAAGLGLIAVIASIVVSVTTARALVAQLQRLRDAAHRLADERLPNVVDRLGRGENVDVATEAPPLAFGTDEIGQVSQAFNAVQETAIRTAVQQAELRRSVRDVFLSLARRTQALVHRQLTLLDAMERRETDAEELDDLFRVDHLATRMRRNAENLIVLSGATPGRAWRRNVPMIDVVRGAVAEVEDYTRVSVLPLGSIGLAGRAVGDVIHLLAELIENALSFSPPHTMVEVRGQMVANGYAIEIEDRGLGMSEEDLAAANEQIVSRQEFNLANAARLGLFVVSRLTERHGIHALLKESSYGGTTAVVLIPSNLVTGDPDSIDATDPALPSGTADTTARSSSAATSTNTTDERPTVRTPGASLVVNPSGPALPTRTRTTATGAPAADAAAAQTKTTGSATQTPSGLPLRVRQASLATPLRQQSETAPEEAVPGVEPPRPPDQIRQMMSSYQSGTRRGRSEAAQLLDKDDDVPAVPDTGDAPAAGDGPVT
ncbi:hypothetical protein GCM10027280_42500 [Micromonospora polyrhachis]|uniref:histidine kinase n=1 Tax=Micromonospora polyrhachis TaxID=1282883 RepID=A0A7W7SXD5_9ACTN|nr:nitrate- and nitrite sensing domain-containing protein [Micromonospora polyrhachis]MBB4962067.1 signal transduction histidine kinase [Micromonospora polyrhachis]